MRFMRAGLVIIGFVCLLTPAVTSASGDSASVIGPASVPADGKTEIVVEVNLPGAQQHVAIGLRQIGDTQIPLVIRPYFSCFEATVCYADSLTNIQKTAVGVYGTGKLDFYIRSTTPSNSVTLVPYIVPDSWHHIPMQSYDNLAVTISFTQAALPHNVSSIASKADGSKSSVSVAGVIDANSIESMDYDRVTPGKSAPADGKTGIRINVFIRNLNGAPISGAHVTLKQVNGNSPVNVLDVTGRMNMQTGFPVPPGQTDENGMQGFIVTSGTVRNAVQFVPSVTTPGWPVTDLNYLPATVSFTPVRINPTPKPTTRHGGVVSASTPAPAPTPKVIVAPRPADCAPRANDEIVNETIGQFFCFAGLNLRVDSVQTVDKADNSPLLTKDLQTTQDPNLGYIVVKITMQNRSESKTQSYPGNWLGFDLAGGSKLDLGVVSGEYVGAGLSQPPAQLAPGQSLEVTYVVANWDRTPIRTMYLYRNVGNRDNDPGVQYARFSVTGL